MRTAEIQSQLNEITAALHLAQSQRIQASSNLANDPSDPQHRKTAQALTTQIRELRDDEETLQAALAEARRHDASDEARAARQRTRGHAKAAQKATRDRIAKAKTLDKAIAQLQAAVADLVPTNQAAKANLQSYLASAYDATEAEQRLTAAIGLMSGATGDAYLIPAIGQALGCALGGLTLPDMRVADWLRVGPMLQKSGPSIEQAATQCAESFVLRIDNHVKARIGLSDSDNA